MANFARHIGQTLERTNDLLQGRATITVRTARELERVLGGSVEFRISRDYQYREDVARIHAEDEEWLNELPISDMIKFGWLQPPPRPSEEVEACLGFFGVPSVAAWRHAYNGLETLVAFKTSPTFDSRPATVTAWMRKGEIECANTECAP